MLPEPSAIFFRRALLPQFSDFCPAAALAAVRTRSDHPNLRRRINFEVVLDDQILAPNRQQPLRIAVPSQFGDVVEMPAPWVGFVEEYNKRPFTRPPATPVRLQPYAPALSPPESVVAGIA